MFGCKADVNAIQGDAPRKKKTRKDYQSHYHLPPQFQYTNVIFLIFAKQTFLIYQRGQTKLLASLVLSVIGKAGTLMASSCLFVRWRLWSYSQAGSRLLIRRRKNIGQWVEDQNLLRQDFLTAVKNFRVYSRLPHTLLNNSDHSVVKQSSSSLLQLSINEGVVFAGEFVFP